MLLWVQILQERLYSKWKKRFFGRYKTVTTRFSQEHSESDQQFFQDLKPDVSKRHLTIFIRLSKNFGSLTCARGLFKIFNFPPKKLRKIHAPIFSINSASNICSNVVNFPAKKLRKNACAVFFFLNLLKRNFTQSLYYCFK